MVAAYGQLLHLVLHYDWNDMLHKSLILIPCSTNIQTSGYYNLSMFHLVDQRPKLELPGRFCFYEDLLPIKRTLSPDFNSSTEEVLVMCYCC